MTELTFYENMKVGEVVPIHFRDDPFSSGIKMGQDLDGIWFIACYIDNISDEVIDIFENTPMEAGYITDENMSMVYSCVKFEGEMMGFGLAFEPTFYPEDEWEWRQKLWHETETFTLLLIDSITWILKVIRKVTIPKELKNIWVNIWDKALTTKNYSDQFEAWIQNLQKSSFPELWLKANKLGLLEDIFIDM
jgi:hypothetical protein